MKLIALKNKYSIYRFASGSPLPDWIYLSDFYSITKTKDELSVVSLQDDNDTGNSISSKDWRIIKIVGPLDLSLIGIIADISAILKNESIPIFAVSTFDTDYILVKQRDLESGIKALREKGHNVIFEE